MISLSALPISAATLKTVGLGLAVVSFMAAGFYLGYRWQSGNVAEAELAASQARTERDRWQQNAQSYETAIERQKAANAAAQLAAEQQQRKADQAIADAKAEQDKYQKKLSQIEAGIEKDKLDPSCKAELERSVCGSPWQ